MGDERGGVVTSGDIALRIGNRMRLREPRWFLESEGWGRDWSLRLTRRFRGTRLEANAGIPRATNAAST